MLRPAILVASTHDADEIKRCGLGEYEIINIRDTHPTLEVDKKYLCYGKDTFTIINNKLDNNGYVNLGTDKNPELVLGYGIHFGLRGDEIFHSCTRIPYLRTADGLIFKFAYLDYHRSDPSWLNAQSYAEMLKNYEQLKSTMKDLELATGISKKNGKPWYRMTYKVVHLSDDVKSFLNDDSYLSNPPSLDYYKLVRTSEDIIKSLTYFYDLPVGTYIGLDYETNGIPFDDPGYFPMGVSLATCEGIAAYYDIEWMMRQENRDNFDVFLKYYKKFLDKHGKYCITYNVGFELRCTYLLLKKMYMFQDAAAINKIEGNNSRRFTLKFTAQKYIPGIGSWDDDFDHFQSLFWRLFKNSDKDNYESSDEWNTIIEYSKKDSVAADIDEMKVLLSRYWGSPFACIPYNTLGKYCCKDSFHTALIRKASDDLGYSQLCWKTFDDNLRMNAWLDINGLFIDYKTNREYSKIAWWMVAYGKLNVSKAYLKWSMKSLNSSISDGLPEDFMKILDLGVNPMDPKSLVSKFLDDESNVDCDKLVEVLGDLGSKIKSYFGNETGFKKLSRSRKLWNTIEIYLRYLWNYKVVDGDEYINNIKVGDMSSLVKYYYYRSKLRLIDSFLSSMKYNDPKDSLEIDGKVYSIDNIKDISDSILNTNSPDTKELLITSMLPRITSIMYDLVNKSPEELIKGNTITPASEIESMDNDSYPFKLYRDTMMALSILRDKLKESDLVGNKELIEEITKSLDNKDPFSIVLNRFTEMRSVDYDTNQDNKYLYKYELYGDPEFPTRVIELAHSKILSSDSSLFNYMLGYGLSRKFLTSDYCDEYLSKFDEIDPSDWSVLGQSKLATCYMMSRKYSKSVGSYLDGNYSGCESSMLVNGHRVTSEYDENSVITEKWNHVTTEESKDVGLHPIQHIYSSFSCMEKKSLRWSAALHTLPGHGTSCQVKRSVTAPKGYLMSYFDISGAEVRSAAFLSKDKFLLKAYSTPRNDEEAKYVGTDDEWRIKGEDPYINCAKIIRPGLSKEEYKELRKSYKTTLLGSIYGMGVSALALRIGSSKEYAQQSYDELFSILKDLKRYIEEKSAYPETHKGYIDSVLGNKINIANERNDKQERLGINLLVQGFSAIALAAGFQHNVEVSFDDYDKWGVIVRPINVVHDSSQCLFNADALFRIQEYYSINMQKYLWDTYGINYAFDTLVGTNYYDMCEVSTIEYDKIITLKGSKYALDNILAKLDEVNTKYKILKIQDKNGDDIDDSQYVSKNVDILKGLLMNDDPYYWDDESSYTITIEKC